MCELPQRLKDSTEGSQAPPEGMLRNMMGGQLAKESRGRSQNGG